MSEDGTDRREALRLFVLGGMAVAGCALAVPAAFVIAIPARTGSSKETWVPTVPLDALQEGVPKRVQIVSDRTDGWTRETHVELGSAWLVRRGGNVTAFSSVCPHLGCAVNAEPNGTYSCPCHTSSFAADGAPVSGPSPRGLDALTTRIDGGVVVVDFRRFKVGIRDRIALG